jgi:hypothetical protein
VTELPESAVDTDGDQLPDHTEVNKWGTDPNDVDSDGDGLSDCIEVYDVDGNGNVLFPTESLYTLKASLFPPGIGPGQFGRDGDLDSDGNGAILFPSDGINSLRAALIPGYCP